MLSKNYLLFALLLLFAGVMPLMAQDDAQPDAAKIPALQAKVKNASIPTRKFALKNIAILFLKNATTNKTNLWTGNTTTLPALAICGKLVCRLAHY